MSKIELLQPLVEENASKELHQDDIFTDESKLTIKDINSLNQIIKKPFNLLNDKELRKLKDIARVHIPSWLRVELWLWVCGGEDVLMEYPLFYQESCEEIFSNNAVSVLGEQEVLSYYLTENGGNTLCKVTYMIKHSHPEITYCPLIDPVIAIMLHFLPEEKVFACIMAMLKNEPMAYFDQTKYENTVTDATLQDLFKLMNKPAYNRFESFVNKPNGQTKLVIFPSWENMLFENLEFITLVRLLDLFFIEGPKVLFRAGLFILDVFYQYSLTFKTLHCSSPMDLVLTIGQHASSLKVTPSAIIKACHNISLTSKKIQSLKEENSRLYKSNRLERQEEVTLNRVVAVDLNRVSDILTPSQWQDVCQWLPPRIQVMEPVLLFSTNQHGYNLATLYDMCEDEDQTLIIIQTTKHEVFGAYLSSSLKERHHCRNGASFFGTGETFIFKLHPTVSCYHWNDKKTHVHEKVRRRKKSKYVFIDTVNLLQKEEDLKDTKLKHRKRKTSRAKSIRKSLRRSLSSNFSRSVYTKRDNFKGFLHPLSAINIRSDSLSVPKNLYMGNLRNETFSLAKDLKDGIKESCSKKSLDKENEVPKKDKNKSENAHKSNSVYSNKKGYLSHGITFELGHLPSLSKQETVGEIDLNESEINDDVFTSSGHHDESKSKFHKSSTAMSFEIIDHESASAPIASTDKESTNKETNLKSLADMFISCDDKRFVIGGGNGEAIHIDRELHKGRSCKCDTFLNAPLTSCENGDFVISRIDVFCFQ